jgi:hypothetical protein
MRGSELIAEFLKHSPFVKHLSMELREIEQTARSLHYLQQRGGNDRRSRPWRCDLGPDRHGCDGGFLVGDRV